MKLSDYITTLEKNERTKSYLNPEILLQAFNINVWPLPEFSKIYIYLHPDLSWICTDTPVGVSFVYLDDVLVAVMTQEARKSDENIHWIDAEKRQKVLEYVLDEIRNQTLSEKVEPMSLDTDMKSWEDEKEETEKIRKKYGW